jgi:hypothetical protein
VIRDRPNRPPAVRRTVAPLLALLALTACSTATGVESCSEYVCLYELSGARSVTVRTAGFEGEMRVAPTGSGSVVVGVGADEATLAEGGSAPLDELWVTAQSVQGDDVELVVCRTGSCGATDTS